MALAASELERLVTRGSVRLGSVPLGSVRRGEERVGEGAAGEAAPRAKALPLGPMLGDIDAALPEAGLPRGAVVEVASPLGLARATSLAVAACVSAQRASTTWSARPAWCAWIDPWGTLHAPGLRASGVDLERLLVVRPSTAALARTAVRVVASGAFAVVVVDTASPLAPTPAADRAPDAVRRSGARGGDDASRPPPDGEPAVRLDRWPTVVRRLALAVEGTDTVVLLLTDLTAARGLPLPVAMRLELERRLELRSDRVERARGVAGGRSVVGRSSVRVAKDRHGRVTKAVPFTVGEPGPEPVVEAAGDLRPALRSATSRG